MAARRATGTRFARAPAECASPLVTIDAATLAAVASLGPDAQIATLLAGDGIECDAAYHVSVCIAGEPPQALWAQAAPWCLPAGTMIETMAGPRLIEKLARGDRVRAFDGAETEARVLDLLTHADRELIAIRLQDGTLLEATPEHRVLAGEHLRPRRVRELSAGDRLYVRTPEGLAGREIVTLEPAGRADVYELRVTAPDTYFANGVLVHNY